MDRRGQISGVLFLAAMASPGCSSGVGESPPRLNPRDGSTGNDGSAVEGTPDASPADESGGPDVAEPDAAPASDASGGTCTDERPQLAAADATNYTVLQYLAQAGILTAGLIKDNWDPTAGIGDVMTFTPGYSVAPTGATYTTVQGAVNAAAAQGGTSRIYIAVSPGTYRETVCLPAGAPPVTLYGTGRDPTQTAIVFGNYNGESLDGGASVNPCTSASASATTVGTAGSATVAVFANDFQAKNITFSNDVSLSTLSTTTGTQAVALMTQADRVVLDSVRVLGHQDTLYIETPGAGTVVRAYVKNSYIQGDVDFIFGGATFVLDGCQIQFVSDRKSSGQALAPSTNSRNPYGGLVVGSNFTADGNTVAGTVGLGRAWDRSCVDVPTYVSNCVASGSYPNGQAVVRDSTLGAHIGVAPWLAAATTKRPYCDTAWNCVPDGGTCPANRLFEYKNTGPGSAP